MQSILKVLILEDVPADAALMEHELKKANIKFNSKIVQTEIDFIYELNSFKPDIILSDYRLPAFNGLEALEIVKNISPDTPFIIVTGTLDEITAVSCIKKGVWDYILKGNLIRLGPAVQEALKLKEEIEKRKSAEQAQQEMEQQYREIFNSSTDAFLIFDMRGNIKEANPQACKMYGYKYKELLKLSGKDIVHPDYYHLFETFKRDVQTAGEFQSESVDVHKDGTFFDIEVKGAEIIYKGKPHLLAIVRDISKRKQAEEALQHEKDFYHSFVESLSDWVWEINLQGIHTYSNKAVEDILGYKVDEVVGFSVKKLWSEKQQRKSDKWLREKLTSGKGWKNFTAHFQHKDGSIRILESTAIPIYDTENKLVGYRGIEHDITSRRQALQKIQESEEKFHDFIDNALDLIQIVDGNGKFLFANKRWKEVLGYSEKDLKNLKFQDILRKDYISYCNEVFNKLSQGENFENVETVFLSKKGKEIYVEGNINARIENGKFISSRGIFRDITERKEAEEALRKSNEELRKLHRELEDKVMKAVDELRDKDHILIHQSRQASMGEMIGNIAHQWRQPLSAVAAIIQNYEDAYEDGTLDMNYIEEHTDLIMDILQQMSRTIDDFRNFFKPNKLKIDFNVKEVVLNTIKFLETSIKFNNIKLILNLPDDCIITGFPNEYSQVILVILNNAKDVLLERKIKEKQIEINLEKVKNKTILKIIDNAGGIAAKVMEKIFNPYFTTKEDKGTGVGLYMSKMIIEKNMKGKLSFGNTKKGAEFIIEV